MDDPRLLPLGQFTPEGVLTPGYGVGKTCRVCGVEKLIKDFKPFGKNGRTTNKCRKCIYKSVREHDKQYPEVRRRALKRYKILHPNYQNDWKKTPNGKYSTYKGQARGRQIQWDLSREQFDAIVYQPCYYCGISYKYGVGIDRKDSSLGYTVANSLPSCTRCNYMKLTDSREDFIKQIKRIYTHLESKRDIEDD